MAAIRLICPFSIESPFSVRPSTEPIRSSSVVEGKVQNFIPSIDSRLIIVENTINPILTETFAYNESDSAAPLQVVTDAAGFVWGCGVVLLIICAMGSAIRLHKLVREAVCVRGNIYICDAVRSPFILGIVRPKVYLPSALSDREMEYILAHESAHLKRKDHWWKALGYLLLCIYWFNPLCWVAYSLLCKDIELACDEKVARDMTLHEKKEYSKVLLSCAGQRSLMMVCPLAFGEVGVKERVKSVCYSDEEISPKGNTLTFYAGEGLGDTEITLLPIEVREENAYDEPAYITPGMPVKMDAEKGAWFKIGVNIQNPTEESKDVYISVRNVDVRIAAAGNQKESKENGLISDKEAGEILQRYLSSVGQWNNDYKIESLNSIAGTIEDNIRAYRFELRYQDTIEQVSGRLIGNYAVTDDGNNVYWYDSANDAFIMQQDVVKLSMATDGYPNFHIDGIAYDYRPVSDWNNSEFYKCFNEIPWE